MSRKESIIWDWIMANKEEGITAEQIIQSLEFLSYSYEKYGETVFAMKVGNRFNMALIHNISQDLHDGTRKGYEETRDFAECLGKRMALCLNYFRGVSNNDIEKLVNKISKKGKKDEQNNMASAK